ncbi:hypothetical protein B0J12DRAFT_654527 [Macrophomina phaseolina]|uniref:SWI-SNF chromatin-remodeling complex protein n=1 Tax=Macrophomina phaseolina TaxID=35725 RepID=A0ABQ8GME7_9PEZI|nr:hypothetical protein B0J12DRAFT_654527 [Macrophomina phaseolina]
MSGPYRFGPDRVTSPLDQRPPNPFPSGQPPSFKTNINRNKTKKWVTAKAVSYDGDDWEGYDSGDEYGVAAHASQNPQAPTGLRQRGQSVDKTGATRSFTEPVQPPASGHARNPSFEYGEEKRAFSHSLNHAQTLPVQPPPIDTSVPGSNAAGKAPVRESTPAASSSPLPSSSSSAQPPAGSYQEPPSAQSRISTTSWAPSVVSDSSAYQDPQNRRDFSESALPPPLQMRSSNTPTPSRFPPRKSSLSQPSPAEQSPSGDTAQSTPKAPRQRAPSNPNKPLPFIRPADIYKRVEEERRKASMDSERPSLDSVGRPSQDEVQSPGASQAGSSDDAGRVRSPNAERYDGGRGQTLAPLETVAERKSEYMPDFSLAEAESAAKASPATATLSKSEAPQISALPPVPVSSFGADFWDSAERPYQASSSAQDLAEANKVLPQPEAGPTEEPSLHHQPSHGFRTAVRNAFERVDDNSVPPTPVSKSNSLSAGGSGVSRSNTDSTAGISPIMSHVPSGANPTSWKRDMENTTPAIAEEPSGASRPTSSGTLQQVQRKPSPSHSRDGSASSIPRIGTPTGRRPLGTPSPSHSPARSPFIESTKPLPLGESGELGGAQTSFLEHRRSSNIESSPERASPITRAESPTKGRVRDLAGKFNDIVDSRRNSTQSISSVKSNGSGNKRFSRSPSPTKESASERPQPEREVSFRPKLPGTWESYTTTGQSSPDKEKQEPIMDTVREGETTPPTKNRDALEETDITPTTAKRPVDHKDAVDPVHDPMAALAAAGAAIGESIKSAVAPGQRSPAKSEPESWEGSIASDDEQPKTEEEKKDRAVGDVYLHPLQLDRTAPSIASSSEAPTPGVNEDERESYSPVKAPPPLRSSRSPSAQPPELEIPDATKSASEEYSPGPDTSDLETDRLTADIMKRLSTPSLVGSVPEINRTLTPQPTAQDTPKALQENRASSVVPSEYENYWAAGGEEVTGADSDHAAAPLTVAPETTIRAVKPEESDPPAGDSSSRSGFLSHRFSWEREAAARNAAAQAAATEAQAPAASEEPTSTALGTDSAHLAAAQKSEDHPSVAKAIAELPDAPERTSDGLHIVNPEPELASSSSSAVELEAPAAPNQPLDADAWRAQTHDVDPPSSQSPLTPGQHPASATAQQQPRIPLFREILALKSTEERLSKYNQAREQFAGMDTGLRNWVSSTLATKPEHAELANLPKQPLPPIQSTYTSSGGGLMRHKHNASISHFATGFRKNNQTASNLTSGSTTHDSIASPTDGGQQSSAGREKMQAKGMDLLKGAGVLGGKGMKEAKGFFAKGRSRFRGESKQASFRNITPYDHPSPSNVTASSLPAQPSQPEPTNAIASLPSAAQAFVRGDATRNAGETPPVLSPVDTAQEPNALQSPMTPATPATPLDEGVTKEREKKKRSFSFSKLRQRSKSASRSRPTSIVLDEVPESSSAPPPPPPVPKDFTDEAAGEKEEMPPTDRKQEVEKGIAKGVGEEPKAKDETQERKEEAELGGGHQEDQELAKSVSRDRNAAVDAVDIGAEAGTAADRPSTEVEAKPSDGAPGVSEIAFETGVAPSQGRRPSQDVDASKRDRPEMNVSKPVSRQVSRVNSAIGSRPASSIGSGSAFVAPEDWDSVPNPASGAKSPVNRSMNQSPVSRTGTPGRSFAERAQSPIQRSTTPGSITMPTAQYGESSQKANGRWERLGVLPSPNIEPLSWLDEKEKRRSLAAEQRMERVIESVVRNSTPVSVRSKGSAGSMSKVVGEEQDVGKSRAVESDTEEPIAGGKSSRQSFAQRATGASSRQSIRTRDSKGSIASLLPVPLDEMAKKDLTLEDHELDRPKFDVSPIDLGDPAERDEQFRKATSTVKVSGDEGGEARNEYGAPDAHAGAQRSPSPSPSPDERHAKANDSAEQIPRVASPLQDITAAAASSDPPRQAPTGGLAPAEDQSRKYQVGPANPEFDVPRQRQARGNFDQGPRPFSYMEGQSTQEESLQQGYMGPRGPVPGSTSGMERGMRYARRGPHSWQPPPPGLGGYGVQQQAPYGQRQFQSPPPGLVEGRLGQPQGQEGFNRQDFDPRSYSSEFELPGVGPPDHSEASDLRQKRRSILGGIGPSKTTPSESNTPASKSSERVNERINPQHVDPQLHRTFSYQSSANENELGLTKGGRKDQKKQGPDVLEEMAKATDPANQKQKRQRSGIFAPFKRSEANNQQQKEATAAEHGHFSTPPPESATPSPDRKESKKGRNKLQRNASSGRLPDEAMAVEKKEKKKRTSLLGSIFGRSGSEAKQREKEEKKLRKSESKGKLSKLRKSNLTQPPVPDARSAAYAPVPQPPSSFQGPRGAGETPPAEESQPESSTPGSQKLPTPGSGLHHAPPPSGYPAGPGYPPPRPAMYGGGNGFAPPQQQQPAPPAAAAFRTRYYQPQRALSQDRALYPNGPPPPHMQGYPPLPQQQPRRFSEQMLQQQYQMPPHRAYQMPPLLHQQQQYPHHPSVSGGSTHGSDYNNGLSPQISAMTPPSAGGGYQRHGSVGPGGEDTVVSPITSGGSSSGYAEGGREYFGPGRARNPSDPFERQRLWYQQQQQAAQQQQQTGMGMGGRAGMGRIVEGVGHGDEQQQVRQPLQQQQRPFELSLPGNEDEDEGERDAAPAVEQVEKQKEEKEKKAWLPSASPAAGNGGTSGTGSGYREVLPRTSAGGGYAPPIITTSPSSTTMTTAGGGPAPIITTTTTTTTTTSSSSSSGAHAHLALSPSPGGGRPSPTRIEARWTEVAPEDAEAALEKLREHKAREQLAAQEQERNVHPAYRHSPNPSLGGGSIVLSSAGHSPRLPPPGLEGQQGKHQRSVSGGLQMDPAYAKEYGIVEGPAAAGGGGGVKGGGAAAGAGAESSDEDDDEDLYAEPTVYRSKESGQQGAQVLERARSEAGDTPSPPTVPASMVQENPPSPVARKAAALASQEKEVVNAAGEQGRSEGGGQRRDVGEEEDEEEPVVMHGASYPGMEWTPRWDGTIE